VKAHVCFCFDDEDSFEYEIEDCMVAELAVLKSSQNLFRGSYRQRDSNWEPMCYDSNYLTDDEFFSHFNMDQFHAMQLFRLVKEDHDFRSVSGNMGKRSSMLHIMMLFLGSYGNGAALQKLGLMMGISKGAVNYYVRRVCNAILKHHEQFIKWPKKEE